MNSDSKLEEKSANVQSEEDRFKETFKKYKSCKDYQSFSNFKEIFEPERENEFKSENIAVRRSARTRSATLNEDQDKLAGDITILNSPSQPGSGYAHRDCKPLFGLTHPSTWQIFDFSFPNGLIFIKNPFTPEGQRYWITKCLNDYPKEPHVTNIDNLKRRQPISAVKDDFKIKLSDSSEGRDKFYKDLRWITFGYHHDWDTKVYSEDYRCEFPRDLSVLTKYMSLVLGYDDFEAEAAIVNYYHLDSTLSGHVDRSEKNQFAPLFSLSFGQTAIFLIGAETKAKTPLAVYLKSGDIVVMTGQSRLSYHAVPKIIFSPATQWKDLILETSSELRDNSSEYLENGSVKKKLKLESSTTLHSANCKLCKLSESSELNKLNPSVQSVLDQWSDFHESYISKSRINLNVRQVLFPGQKSLNDEIIP